MLRSIYTVVNGRPHQVRVANKFLRSVQTGNTRSGDSFDEKTNATLDRIKKELAEDKKALKWRPRAGDRPEDWSSKLKAFENEEQTSDYILMMQKPISLNPKSIRNWWKKRQEKVERHLQQYIPERHEILGADLAAAHFLLYRGGAVKFTGERTWLRANENGEFNLPKVYHPLYKVEALRCDNMKLYYEGLENLRCLQHLKFLSYHNVTTFDDWCLDRVSGSQYPKLEVLDISGTKCTAKGLTCLYRIPSLKLLIVDNPKISLEYELTCSMLEEIIPALKIVGADAVHNLDTKTLST